MVMLINPTNDAANNELKMIFTSNESEVNFTMPADKEVIKIAKSKRLGTLNKMAKPVPITPDQKAFSAISKKIVIS